MPRLRPRVRIPLAAPLSVSSYNMSVPSPFKRTDKSYNLFDTTTFSRLTERLGSGLQTRADGFDYHTDFHFGPESLIVMSYPCTVETVGAPPTRSTNLYGAGRPAWAHVPQSFLGSNFTAIQFARQMFMDACEFSKLDDSDRYRGRVPLSLVRPIRTRDWP